MAGQKYNFFWPEQVIRACTILLTADVLPKFRLLFEAC